MKIRYWLLCLLALVMLVCLTAVPALLISRLPSF